MSLHFDFALACILKPDTPQDVLDRLEEMTRTEDWYAASSTDEPHTTESDKAWRMRSWGAQPRFSGVFGGALLNAYQYEMLGQTVYRYTFCCRSAMLDDIFYEEMLSFPVWLAQYSETEGWVGWFREEHDLHPTLIYFLDGKVYLGRVAQSNVVLEDLYGKPREEIR